MGQWDASGGHKYEYIFNGHPRWRRKEEERKGIQENNSCKLPTVTENYGLHIQKNQDTPSRKNPESYTQTQPAGNAGITIKSQ